MDASLAYPSHPSISSRFFISQSCRAWQSNKVNCQGRGKEGGKWRKANETNRPETYYTRSCMSLLKVYGVTARQFKYGVVLPPNPPYKRDVSPIFVRGNQQTADDGKERRKNRQIKETQLETFFFSFTPQAALLLAGDGLRHTTHQPPATRLAHHQPTRVTHHRVKRTKENQTVTTDTKEKKEKTTRRNDGVFLAGGANQ